MSTEIATRRREVLPQALPNGLTRLLLWSMATAAGIGIANIYYNQPLLDQMQRTFGVDSRSIGWVPTLTQLGYAIGMLLLVPLGDMFQRKRLVVLFTSLGALAALGLAIAPGLQTLLVVSFLFGLATMTPQLLVPFAAHLARNEEKGKVVGFMVSGILLGILLARTVAGFVGAAFGWRAMFGLAAAVLAITAVIMAMMLPRTEPTYKGHYLGLLATVWQLLRDQPVLREACLFGSMLFGSFMVFWSSLIHLMESPTFQLGPRAVGLYGLLGAAAALMSPLIGGLADKTNPRRLTGVMILLAISSYAIFYYGQYNLLMIAVGVLVMDVGVQLGHVTNQGRIFKLVPSAQSRIQTAYMFFYFTGASVGSALGAAAWSRFGWAGVCGSAVLMLVVAGVRWLMPAPKQA
ncbi:MFS transporter [Burkholderia cepacia]|uniref:MFS transporter n=1 Tax=Burkholderia cepacia TaxID=292 RepID=UPI00298F5AF5|nr:MFS transporter [Burkholderia cepacia]MDW9248033.1 major Facilitator Superfamily protein [Burkholderia cepacia]